MKRAAPPIWPYLDHRNMAEVMRRQDISAIGHKHNQLAWLADPNRKGPMGKYRKYRKPPQRIMKGWWPIAKAGEAG